VLALFAFSRIVIRAKTIIKSLKELLFTKKRKYIGGNAIHKFFVIKIIIIHLSKTILSTGKANHWLSLFELQSTRMILVSKPLIPAFKTPAGRTSSAAAHHADPRDLPGDEPSFRIP
jgi:hypothetical protein